MLPCTKWVLWPNMEKENNTKWVLWPNMERDTVQVLPWQNMKAFQVNMTIQAQVMFSKCLFCCQSTKFRVKVISLKLTLKPIQLKECGKKMKVPLSRSSTREICTSDGGHTSQDVYFTYFLVVLCHFHWCVWFPVQWSHIFPSLTAYDPTLHKGFSL